MQTELLLRQTRRHLPAYRAAQIDIEPIEKGGSDRRYYRVRSAPEQSIILVKYNLERDENRHYVEIARFLSEHGLAVPRVYFHDPGEGLIWIEDLGDTDLFSFRHQPWSMRRPFYQSALNQMVKLHKVPKAEWVPLCRQMPPEFNMALYEWEQRYFFENCLGRVCGMSDGERRSLATLPALTVIVEHLASLPRTLVHRDFQSQNIIMREGRAFLIDFQGMRPGLPEYDLASLLYDPYVLLTAEERKELCSEYIERRGIVPGSADVCETLRLCAMQRLMQALGAYGYLGLVKGNRGFLDHVPSAMTSLRDVLAGVRGLEPLGAALASLHGDVTAG